jgi:murein DD-endopeptidase MepM/ murein hydrolase activator NlpD
MAVERNERSCHPRGYSRERARPATIRSTALALAAALASLSLPFSLSGCREADESAAGVPAVAEVRHDTLTARVQVGESFNSIVQALGLDEEESALLLASIKENYRFKLYAGQLYQAVFRVTHAGTALESFSLEDRNSDHRHRLVRNETSESGFRIASLDYAVAPIPMRTDTILVTGTLHTSLYEAFLAKGESPALIQLVTKIFAWDVDFFKDPRVGDEFSLLVEKRMTEDGAFRSYGDVLSAKYVNSGHEYYGILYKGAYYDHKGRSLEKMLLKAPLNFARVSSGFGTRLHPILGVRRPHWGIDYAAPKGTKILAAGDGTVEYAKWVNGYGKTIKIRHNSIYSTYYAHLNGFAPGVHAGKRVGQRDVIGYLGSTGLSTAPHLDYRVERNGQYINPASLKTESKEGVTTAEWKEFSDRRDQLLARMFAPDYRKFARAEPSPAPGAPRSVN